MNMKIQPGPSYHYSAAPPRSYIGIGPLEVLRVALMRGDLDDLRNDLARALRRNDIAPRVLEGLLYGLQGVGIRLDGARAALCVGDAGEVLAQGEGLESVRGVPPGVGPADVADSGCESRRAAQGTGTGCRGRAASGCVPVLMGGDEGTPSISPGLFKTVPATSERQAQASAPCVCRRVSECAAVARTGAVYIDPAADPSTSRISRAPFFSFSPDVGPGYSASEVAPQSDGARSQHMRYVLLSESLGPMCSMQDGALDSHSAGVESEKENSSVRTSSSSILKPKTKLRRAINTHNVVAERASNATSMSKSSGKKPTRRKRAPWGRAKTS